jgi:hypothetical protein
MTWRATTTVTVLRGEGTDAWNDTIDIDTPVYEGVRMQISEGGASSRSRPVDGRTDQVRSFTGRCSARWQLRKDDRVRDERTGDVYTIDFLVTPPNPVNGGTWNLTLRRVS